MNFKIIGRTVGIIMLVEAVCMLPELILSLILSEDVIPFLLSAAILVAIGLPISRFSMGKSYFSSKSASFTVALSWLTLSLGGALPFLFSGFFASPVDCFFEAVSGFTTTGATILSDIEALPRGILLWRSFTHFLGGMGILVLATAILPASGDRSHHLMQAEVPGPTADKLVPRLAKSSTILYSIYIALTMVEFICLIISGIGCFDAVNIAFATAGTGGFAVRNASIAAYNNPAAEYIIAVFMLLFSVNFSLYFLILVKKFRQVLKNEELRFFVLAILIFVLLVSFNIRPIYGSASDSFRNAFFTISSITLTTGFVTADFNLWPNFSKVVIVFFMLMGACAGSTGGGLKCSRVLMLIKSVYQEVRNIAHPRAVNVVKLDGKVVDDKTVTSVLRFFAAYMMILLCGTLIVSLDKYDLTTNLTAVISCIGNIGPGLNSCGPVENFSGFSALSKIVLSFCMLAGRLEIFPILTLLTPAMWKKNN